MTNRRDFLKTTTTAGAAAALAGQASALARPREASWPGAQPGDGLRVTVYDVPAQRIEAARQRLAAGARAAGLPAQRLALQAVPHAPVPWMAEDIALLMRYTPSPDGAMLDFMPAEGRAPQLAAFEQFWGGRRNAVVLGVEPYAMLVHRARAREAGIVQPTLAAFAERGVRPRLPLNVQALSTGDNSWIHPLVMHHLGWRMRGGPGVDDLFLSDASVKGLDALKRQVLSKVELVSLQSSGRLQQQLLDDPACVAIYGNPLVLRDRLAAAGRSRDDFEVVPLQRFMAVDAPSLFRVAALQVGSQAAPREAAEVARALFPQLQREALPELLPQAAAVRADGRWHDDAHGWLRELRHDARPYAALPHLQALADGRVLTALALTLSQVPGTLDQPGAYADAAYAAASDAFYELAEYDAQQQGARSVAALAAPSLALA